MKISMIKSISSTVTRTFSRVGLKLKVHSPELLMAAGGVSIVAGVVMACKETLTVDDITMDYEEKKDKIESVLADEDHPSYDQNAAAHDTVVLTVQTGVKFVRHYAPAAALIIGGFICFGAAYNILHKRNVALMAAYAALDETFKKYRSRVREDLDEDWDRHFLVGDELKEVKCKCGSTKKVPMTSEEASQKVDGFHMSGYARLFDESSPYFKKNALMNRTFIICQQNHANDILRGRGHLFLNDVYRMLGMPDTKEGSVVGWVLGKDCKDGYVDFGLYDEKNPGVNDFMEGFEPRVWLDFNVDGVIYDLI